MGRVRTGIAALALLAASQAQAAIVIDAAQTGPDVVFSFLGDFSVAGLSNIGSSNDNEIVAPAFGGILFRGTGLLDGYATPDFPSFGPGGPTPGTATGDIFKLYSGGFVGFAPGYAGETISGALTLAGQTFATLGVTPGTYSVTAANGSQIVLNIPDARVPVPAALPLLAGGLAGLALLRRRRGA